MEKKSINKIMISSIKTIVYNYDSATPAAI
jgi:hypothetical protein